jgi:UDP-N-acetylglucosamine transferase subunit ALG13
MIFVTVGHELHFDRLIKAVDDWCALAENAKVFGQIGGVGDLGYKPQNFEWKQFIESDEFTRRFEEAQIIVAHAGMGTIITALTMKKPIVIMPRKGSLKETRNDHQIATAEQFAKREGIYVAADETELGIVMNQLMANPPSVQSEAASKFANPDLLDTIREFIFRDEKPLSVRLEAK